jgi:hypothetical protein
MSRFPFFRLPIFPLSFTMGQQLSRSPAFLAAVFLAAITASAQKKYYAAAMTAKSFHQSSGVLF